MAWPLVEELIFAASLSYKSYTGVRRSQFCFNILLDISCCNNLYKVLKTQLIYIRMMQGKILIGLFLSKEEYL